MINTPNPLCVFCFSFVKNGQSALNECGIYVFTEIDMTKAQVSVFS